MAEGPAMGIDLGTAYSCVGVWHNGRVNIIENDQGKRITPSYVGFQSVKRQIGDAAKNHASSNYNNTVFDVKRLIGRKFSSDSVQSDIMLLPFEVIASEGDRPMFSIQYQGDEMKFTTEEISSMMLMKMRKMVEASIGLTVQNAVISVPALFNDSQRQAIKDAGAIAGLNVMRVINETTAAAIAFTHDNASIKGKRNLLIFNLGAGALDVSVVTMEGRDFKVRATAGDAHLGGVDFDNRLIDHCKEEFNKMHYKDMSGNHKALGKLRTSCEKAKTVLSSITEAFIELDSLFDTIDFNYHITREKFEELNNDLFQRCIDTVERCLKDANMYRNSIDDVVLVGGSTRIPKIQKLLREFFDGKQLCKRINPDEAVAFGATIASEILSRQNQQKIPLIDVASLSIGIDTDRGGVVIIPRNAVIPSQFSVPDEYKHSSISFKVYEGENTRIRENNLLGEFSFGGNDSVLAEFSVDKSGIITIFAENRTTGERSAIKWTVKDVSRLSEKEIRKMIENSNRLKVEENKYKKRAEAKNELEKLTYRLRKIVMDERGRSELGLEEEIRRKLEDKIQETIQWLDKYLPTDGEKSDGEYKRHVSLLIKALPSNEQNNLLSSMRDELRALDPSFKSIEPDNSELGCDQQIRPMKVESSPDSTSGGPHVDLHSSCSTIQDKASNAQQAEKSQLQINSKRIQREDRAKNEKNREKIKIRKMKERWMIWLDRLCNNKNKKEESQGKKYERRYE